MLTGIYTLTEHQKLKANNKGGTHSSKLDRFFVTIHKKHDHYSSISFLNFGLPIVYLNNPYLPGALLKITQKFLLLFTTKAFIIYSNQDNSVKLLLCGEKTSFK